MKTTICRQSNYNVYHKLYFQMSKFMMDFIIYSYDIYICIEFVPIF